MPALFPWAAMRQRPPGLWRYWEALPIHSPEHVVTLGETQTPTVAISAGPVRLFLKLDYLFPTGSFKDRGAAVLLSKVRELGVSSLVEDSSGNAGAAIAAYAAAAGVQADIYVPDSAPAAKTVPISLYGARVTRVPGPRAAVAAAAWQQARESYYASHAWNPFFLEGTKTIAFEIWEQMGEHVPDWVITPVGHGTMLLGLFKGFKYLIRAGMTSRLPKIVGVQSAACAPLALAFQQQLPVPPALTPGSTLADGIAIERPVRWRQILQAVTESQGTMVTVSDTAIRHAIQEWARRGLLMEPTSATAPAAFRALLARHTFQDGATVVIPITGSGIKTIGKLKELATGE